MADALLIITDDSQRRERRTGIFGWVEHGEAVIDTGVRPERSELRCLSPEDWKAKRYAEEYVRSRSKYF